MINLEKVATLQNGSISSDLYLFRYKAGAAVMFGIREKSDTGWRYLNLLGSFYSKQDAIESLFSASAEQFMFGKHLESGKAA